MLFVAGRKTVKKRKCLLPSTNKELSVRQVVQHVVDGGTSNPQSPSASTRPNQVDSNLRDDAVAVGRETQSVVIPGTSPEDGQGRLYVLFVDVGARRAVAHYGHVVPQ